jgi:hypothetical protein
MTDLWFALISIVVTLILMGDVVRMQTVEALRPHDERTADRYLVLFLWCTSFLTLLPVGVYIVARILGIDNEVLRSIATVAGRIGPLAIAVGLQVFYRRRR